jgi:hypothetical protein
VWLYKHDIKTFLILVVCAIAGLQITAVSISKLAPYATSFFSLDALANEVIASNPALVPDNFQWYIGGLLGLLLLRSLII